MESSVHCLKTIVSSLFLQFLKVLGRRIHLILMSPTYQIWKFANFCKRYNLLSLGFNFLGLLITRMWCGNYRFIFEYIGFLCHSSLQDLKWFLTFILYIYGYIWDVQKVYKNAYYEKLWLDFYFLPKIDVSFIFIFPQASTSSCIKN